jgi:hypothetical protein
LTNHELFTHAVRALYGTGWHGPLADALGVSLRTTQRWGTGAMPIPNGIWGELSTLLAKHATLTSALGVNCARVAASLSTSTSEEE